MITMDFYFINDGALWMEILIIFLGIIFIIIGQYCLKKEYVFIPIIYFYKDKNPSVYWIIISYWLGLGIFLIILGFIMIL